MSNYTLLLIDYEPRSIERMRRPLEQAGIRVEVATDGSTGLAAFERLQPDAVIVEAMLPKRHGFEVCQEIKKTAHGKRTAVIVTTGVYKGRRYRTQAMHIHGADEYLEKPLTDQQIVDTVRKFLADRPARPATTSPDPAPAPPSPALSLDPGASDIFDIVDESLSLPKPSAPTPRKPPSPTTARTTSVVGEMSDDEISARLDALLPSDPSTPTEVSWESGQAIGHLDAASEVQTASTTAVVEGSTPEFAPMPEVGTLPEDIQVDAREVDLEAPRRTAQVVPFDAGRPSRRREAAATNAAPPRASGSAAVAPVVEIAPPVRVAPPPTANVPLTEAYETPKRGLPWWIWVAALGAVAAGAYFLFLRPQPPAFNPYAQAASSRLPEPTPAEVPTPEPQAESPAPITLRPVEPEPAPPAVAPPVAARETTREEPAPVKATPPPPALAPTPAAAKPKPAAATPSDSLDDPSLRVAPVAPAVSVATATRPTTRPGDLVSINEVDTLPVSLQKPAPTYTHLGRARRQEGTVVMEVLVDETGRVTDVRLVRGIAGSDLNEAAMEAARSWVYKPAEKNGVPVRVWRPEQVRFQL